MNQILKPCNDNALKLVEKLQQMNDQSQSSVNSN